MPLCICQIDAITLSGDVFGKQKLDVTSISKKQDIDFQKKKLKTDHVQDLGRGVAEKAIAVSIVLSAI